MNFGANHYVPVLKVKRGEKKALQLIRPDLTKHMTPLLEIVVRTDKTLDEHLETAFKGLADGVQSYPRCFLDAREIASDGPSAVEEVFRLASTAGIVFTPVTGISRASDIEVALKDRANGVALRLTRKEFEDGNLRNDLQAFMRRYSLGEEETDLIIDLGPVENLVAAGVIALTDAFLADVPDHLRWRTFTVSGCAFPSSMGGVSRNSYDKVARAEWTAWRDGLHAIRSTLQRLPTFSDCAIQHPIGVEGFNPRTMQVSAAVRYTLEEDWLLIKGESTRNKLPSEQFPALAKGLVNGSLRAYFCGANHCAGCKSIKDVADGAEGFGSAEAWRRIGTAHHLTTVATQLAGLP